MEATASRACPDWRVAEATKPDPCCLRVAGGLIAWGTAIAGIAVVDVIVRQILLEDVRTYLARTAAGTAALIDGDQLRDLQQTPIRTVRRSTTALPVLFGYCSRRIPTSDSPTSASCRTDVMHFILDGTRQGTFDEAGRPNHSPPMEVDEPSPGEREVSRTHRLTVEKEPTATAWGMGIRAHAPVFARDGEMTGYVGITVRADRYRQLVRRVDVSAVLGVLIAGALAFLNGVAIWRAQISRRRAMTAQAHTEDGAETRPAIRQSRRVVRQPADPHRIDVQRTSRNCSAILRTVPGRWLPISRPLIPEDRSIG